MKRSAPIQRTELKRSPATSKEPAAEPKPVPGPRKRKCSCCGEPFQPSRMGQQVRVPHVRVFADPLALPAEFFNPPSVPA